MKTLLHSFALAFQFFTIIPVNKQLPLTKSTITGMFVIYPWIGALMGSVVVAIYSTLQLTETSALLTAFLLFLAYVIWTGGLHLDGFTDMGDAYFSYRDQKKRLEILDDPRVGAFGAMALLFIVLTKIFFLAELVSKEFSLIPWLIFVPFLARIGMSLYLVQTKPSKENGIGYFFKSHLHIPLFTTLCFVTVIVGIVVIGLWTSQWAIVLIMTVVTLCATFIFKKWTVKNFNGSSGDLYGAFIEGMEAILWIVLLLLS